MASKFPFKKIIKLICINIENLEDKCKKSLKSLTISQLRKKIIIIMLLCVYFDLVIQMYTTQLCILHIFPYIFMFINTFPIHIFYLL